VRSRAYARRLRLAEESAAHQRGTAGSDARRRGDGRRRRDGSGGTGGQQDKDEPGVRAQLAQLGRRALKRPAGPWPVEGSDSGGDFLDEVHEAGIRTGSLQSHCTVRAQVRVSTRCSPGALDLSCWNLPSKLEGAHTGALSGGDRGPRVFPRDPDTLQAKSSGLHCPAQWDGRGGRGAALQHVPHCPVGPVAALVLHTELFVHGKGGPRGPMELKSL